MKTRKLKNQPSVAVDIHEIGAKGDGVGTHNGLPVYVGKTAAADKVEIRLESGREDGYRARLINILNPSPDRAPAPCPYYDPLGANCGGCSLQHITLEKYRAWKIAKVQDALARAGVAYEKWEDPVFLPHATRRRATFTAYKANRDIRLGYNEARTHNIIDIPSCMVLEPELDAKAKALRAYLPRLLPENRSVDIMLQRANGAFDMVLSGEFKTGGKFSYDQDEAMGALAEALDIARISFRARDFGPLEVLLSRKPVAQKFGPLIVDLPPASFLQASAAGEAALAGAVRKYAGAAAAIADLFCGAGAFAGTLLDDSREIYAADSDGPAIAALSQAAKPYKNLTVEKRDLFKNPLSPAELSKFEAIVFDPPRAGAKELADALARSEAAAVIAVSCNPATFARDARILAEGGYKLRAVQLIDQFVWSAHVELCALFAR